MKKHEHSGLSRKVFEDPEAVLVAAGLAKGAKVLIDIGSGTGYLAVAAAGLMGSGSKVYAFDIHQRSVDELKAELSQNGIVNVEPVLADASAGLPLPKATADICLLSNVLHGFVANSELDSVIKNVNAVLKEEAKLILIDFKKSASPFGPPMDIRLSSDEAESAVSPYGYQAEKYFEAGPYHYGITLKRINLQDRRC